MVRFAYTFNGTATFPQFLAQDGSAAVPSYAFLSDKNTGFAAVSADVLGFITNGNERFRLDSGGLYGNGQPNAAKQATTGPTATIPGHTFQGDTNTGLGRAGDDKVSLIAGGVEIMQGVASAAGNYADIKQGVVFSGIIKRTIVNVLISQNIGDNDANMFLCDTALGAIILTLPTAADNTGRELTVIKQTADANTVTIDGEGAETINGAANNVLGVQYDTNTYICDGIEWYII